MEQKQELNNKFVEFLTKYYSNNDDKKLAAHLTIIASADCEDSECEPISEQTVSYYAKILGLKKAPTYKHSCVSEKSVKERVKRIGQHFSFYSGNPAMDIQKANLENDHLVLCASKKQMRNIRYAATRYNNEQSSSSGIHIKVSCDSEITAVLIMAETISLPDSCKTRSSQSVGLYVPP